MDNNIFITAIMGLISGGIAKFIMPGKDPGGIIVTMLIGVVGSFVGKYIFGMLGMQDSSGFVGFGISVLGALILLAIWKFVIAPMLNKEAQ